MKIAQIAPLQVATPPTRYGGTERVISYLTEELVQLGHEVTLFATGDSKTSARLIAGIPQAINFDPQVDATAYHLAMLEEVYHRADEFDIIHSHLDYLHLPFLSAVSVPIVTTVHGRTDELEFTRNIERISRSSLNSGLHFVAISEHQRSLQPDLNWVATIHHGIDVSRLPFNLTPANYLCFVGRIAPEKGPVQAIEIAKRAGIPLKIAAKVDPKDHAYYTSAVEPLLDHPLIEFVGELDEAEKRKLMSGALALLLPIDWPEPFGLVFIEALACGTPVLTRPRGAAPELLRDGVTGFLRDTVEELAQAVAWLPLIDRAACRREVLTRFTLRRMANQYSELYSRLCCGVPAEPGVQISPLAVSEVAATAGGRVDTVQ